MVFTLDGEFITTLKIIKLKLPGGTEELSYNIIHKWRWIICFVLALNHDCTIKEELNSASFAS